MKKLFIALVILLVATVAQADSLTWIVTFSERPASENIDYYEFFMSDTPGTYNMNDPYGSVTSDCNAGICTFTVVDVPVETRYATIRAVNTMGVPGILSNEISVENPRPGQITDVIITSVSYVP